jgi:hypothetical protein
MLEFIRRGQKEETNRVAAADPAMSIANHAMLLVVFEKIV